MARKKRVDPWLFVEVIWHDATSDSSWVTESDLPNLTRIQSRGWLCRKTRLCITLASSVDPSGQQTVVGEVITIPRGCVESITELKCD